VGGIRGRGRAAGGDRLPVLARGGQRAARGIGRAERGAAGRARPGVRRRLSRPGWLLLSVVVYAELALRFDALWLPGDVRSAVALFAAAGVAIALLPVSLLAWAEPDEAPAAPPPLPLPSPAPRRYAARLDDGGTQRWLH
jgi:hypothetical protein